jgi:hypothetical protein
MDYDVIGKVAVDNWEVMKKFFEENKKAAFSLHHSVVDMQGLKVKGMTDDEVELKGEKGGARIMKNQIVEVTVSGKKLTVYFKTSGLFIFEAGAS